jgi:DNA-3-methyladenine glycosylase
VLEVAPDLIGCVLSRDGVSGMIVETEAYHGSEPASHAFSGPTPRTRTLFGEPGRAYVYRSYGVHALVNAVCEPEGIGAAVLIRALQPLQGVERMRRRRELGARRRSHVSSGGRRPLAASELCSGPGKLSEALAIELGDDGSDLGGSGTITISSPASALGGAQILVGVRVGITKAVDLPWRFCLAGSEHVSRPRPRPH